MLRLTDKLNSLFGVGTATVVDISLHLSRAGCAATA